MEKPTRCDRRYGRLTAMGRRRGPRITERETLNKPGTLEQKSRFRDARLSFSCVPPSASSLPVTSAVCPRGLFHRAAYPLLAGASHPSSGHALTAIREVL